MTGDMRTSPSSQVKTLWSSSSLTWPCPSPPHSLVGMLFCSKDTALLTVLLLYFAVSCLCLLMLFPVCSCFTLPGKLLLLLLISLQASSLLWEVFYSFRQTKVSFPLCFHRTSQLYKFSDWALMASKPSSELGTPSSQRKFELSLDLRTHLSQADVQRIYWMSEPAHRQIPSRTEWDSGSEASWGPCTVMSKWQTHIS